MVFQQKLSKKDNFKLTGRAMVRPRPVLTNGKRPKIQWIWRKKIDLVVLLYRVKWSWLTAQAYSHRVCTLELFAVFNIKLKKYNFNIKNKKIYRREVTGEYTEKNLDMTKPKWGIFKPKTSDISKLLYVISRAVWREKFQTILKYHEWCLCQISLQIMLLPIRIFCMGIKFRAAFNFVIFLQSRKTQT